MPIEIPVLDLRPKLITFAMRGDFTFPITPAGSPVLWMITSDTCTTVPAEDWLDVDLRLAAEFCASGTTFSIHTKRVLALLAHWRTLRGDREAEDWHRIFLNTKDLCEAFYGNDIYLSMDDRRNFSIENIAKVLDIPWQPFSLKPEEVCSHAQRILITLCQKIHSVR